MMIAEMEAERFEFTFFLHSTRHSVQAVQIVQRFKCGRKGGVLR
jgi:hypothetical protein